MRDSFRPKQRQIATRLGITAMTWLLSASMVLFSAQTQPTPKPFTKDDVLKLLTGNVPVRRVQALALERGIDFQITPEAESELRKAGGTDPLLATLRDLAPKPPTLVVTTTPGGAQVFVDDELMARASIEGRLRISNLVAGPHTLRVSLDGYREYERTVELVVGKVLEVTATLEPAAQPNLPAALPKSAEASRARGTAGVNASGPSTAGVTLKFRGYDGGTTGTITVGNGKFKFAPSEKEKGEKHPFEVSLSDVVPVDQYRDGVTFYVKGQNESQRTLFVRLSRKESKAGSAANIQRAKDLYEALKAASK